MKPDDDGVQDIDRLGSALIDRMSFFASPQRDEVLLKEAGVGIDRARSPLLVRLGNGVQEARPSASQT